MRVRALPVTGSRGRALVVEDNAVNQEMARAMLDMLGFDVVTASNGHEGVLAAAADPDLDLILMDCQMPVMDGLAAARAIRAAERDGRRVPIVALTGNAMPGDREACVAAGMDDYLAKPFSLTALRGILDRWTAAGRAQELAGYDAALLICARVRRDDGDGRRIRIEHAVQALRFLRRIADEAVARLPHEIRIARAAHAAPRPEVRAGDGVTRRRATREQREDRRVEPVAIHGGGGRR